MVVWSLYSTNYGGGHFRGDGESCAIEGIGIASVALVVRVWLLTKDIDSLFGE